MNINATLLIPLAQIGLGTFLLILFGRLYSSAKNMDNWEVTSGIITKSNIKGVGIVFSPDIEYQYFVLGVEYKGLTPAILLRQTSNRKIAQGWVSEYPVGKKVSVYYNPDIHHMSVLEKGFSVKGSLIVIGMCLFLILTGIVIFFLLIK